MDLISQVFQLLLILFGLFGLFYLLFKMVLWARKGGKGAVLIGALFTMFTPDPVYEKNIKIVQEAKQFEEEQDNTREKHS